MSMKRSEESVAEMYDQLSDVYEYAWKRKGHRSIHLGYYETGDESADEAAEKMIQQLSEQIAIVEDTRILDIGCGPGEDAVWNAKHQGVSVVGIDINQRFLELAREHADDADISNRVTFREDSFHEMATVSDSTVDLVWGLEALAHSSAIREVFEHSARVLTEEGRLAVGDLFLSGQPSSNEVKAQIERLEQALTADIDTIGAVRDELAATGFDDIETEDVTGAVLPSARESYRSGRLFYPIGKCLNVFGLCSQSVVEFLQTSIDLFELLEQGALEYHFVTASRP